jgi:hypothetical protein
MVSIDHFRHELLAQFGRGARTGAIDILINSGELCRSLGGNSGHNSQIFSCCDAMQEEIRPGDTVLLERDSGPGMTVRYLLPRTDGIQIRIPLATEAGNRRSRKHDVR